MYRDIHKAESERSKKIMAIHDESCRVHRQAARHVAAVEKMLAITEILVPSGTRAGEVGDLTILSPDGTGDKEADVAIMECQQEFPSSQVDGFGQPRWTYCTCGKMYEFPQR